MQIRRIGLPAVEANARKETLGGKWLTLALAASRALRPGP